MTGTETTAKPGQWTGRGPVALIVVRGGLPPLGAAETVAEAAGDVLVVGSGAREGARELAPFRPGRTFYRETGEGIAPAALVPVLAAALEAAPLVLLPASPDGRDLAPRLAAALDRPLLAAASRVDLVTGADGAPEAVAAELLRAGGRVAVRAEADAPAVATLLPGCRSAPTGPTGPLSAPEAAVSAGSVPAPRAAVPTGSGPASGPTPASGAAVSTGPAPASGPPAPAPPARPTVPEPVRLDGPDSGPGPAEARTVEVRAPDPGTADLAEAARVAAGGAGLAAGADGAQAAREAFALLERVAAALGAAHGATRVATDAGWAEAHRQIGTTGAAVDPDLYLAFGISGAAQHTGGLGAPRHVVSVNTDPACPMTAMADLGLVTDARALLVELAARLGVADP
ncbi:FAD-binding protein [Nocardiopsis potens]|uniref:FAD-binding protein n=1 Tax=Nocardiopsis potens TaxID=1246458 RepID=UPI00034A1185|nr:FAD-binding protein [Nocardiopsis potens]